MERKPFRKQLLFPPVWLMLLLAAISAAGLILVFTEDLTASPAAYAVYVVSFYTLCVLCAFFAVTLPGRYRDLRERICRYPAARRYMTEPAFKTRVKLYTSLAVNLLYVGVNLLSWFLYRSMWFAVLAVYYVILAVMRGLLLRYVRVNDIGKNYLGELRRARSCSCILLLLNFALTGAVMMILYQNRGYNYHGILIYVMAAYTFCITARAVADLIKYRRYKSPVMTVSKIVALSAALVSMLNLETAMLSRFGGGMAPENRRLLIALTGAGVSIAVIVMSVFMIIRTAKEMKERETNGR